MSDRTPMPPAPTGAEQPEVLPRRRRRSPRPDPQAAGTEAIESPAKVMRIGSMVKQLLDEVRAAPLDERSPGAHGARSTTPRSRSWPRPSRPTCRRSCAGWLRRSTTARCPTEAELRVAQAQLVGWLEGLFHGIQATLFAQQLAARQQLEQMRGQLMPGQGPPRHGARPRPPRHLPLGHLTRARRPGRGAFRRWWYPRKAHRCNSLSSPSQTTQPDNPVDDPQGRPAVVGDSFTHLHVHTEYSMLDGASRVDELVAAAAADGQPALGITDHGNMYGILDFYRACQAQGVKPVLGTEAYMAHDHRSERPPRRGRVDDTGGDTEGGRKLYYHLTLLAETDEGYRNLIQLSSLAFLEGYYYKPRLDWELLERHHARPHRHHRLPRRPRPAVAACRATRPARWRRRAGSRTSSGATTSSSSCRTTGCRRQRETNPKLIEIATRASARRSSPPTTATTPTARTTWPTTRCCASRPGALMSDPKRFQFEGDQHYLKPAQEMRYLFREVPSACDNTLWIAERADVTIEFGKPQLPEFPLPGRLRRRHRLPATPHPRRAPTGGGAGRCPTRSSSGWPTSSTGHRRHGVQLLLPHRVGPHQARQGQRHPGRARARERGGLRGGLLPRASPTSTPSATTCCSSASSTRAASRCPTSTWTSTPATGTR